MTSNPHQFQGYAADRQELAGHVLRGDTDPGHLEGADPALNDALQLRCSLGLARDDLATVSNLSISSWYAISGTAMA